jgi:hypothetical protein
LLLEHLALPAELVSVVYPTLAVAKMTGLPDKLTETPDEAAEGGRRWTF